MIPRYPTGTVEHADRLADAEDRAYDDLRDNWADERRDLLTEMESLRRENRALKLAAEVRADEARHDQHRQAERREKILEAARRIEEVLG